MSNKKLRKIKEVNGWKVNHPHNAANIFYGLFTLLVVAAPLAFLFIPSLVLNNWMSGEAVKFSFNGIDIIKMMIELITYMVNETATATSNELLNALLTPEYVGANIAPIAPYLYLALAGCFGLIIIFSFVLFIVFIVHLIKGYLNHSRIVKVFTFLSFFFALAYSSLCLTFYFAFNNSDMFKTGLFTMDFWYPLAISGGYLVLLVVISVLYSVNFKDSIPESQLEFHDDEPTVEHISKVHEVTKVKYEGSSTLPNDIKAIGGHAFSENQSLVVANIPDNITKLGAGAFSNCLNLKVVSLPGTLKSIGYNCFFNCVNLERINFNGSKDEWKKVGRGSNWLMKAKTTEVICLDGAIIVNPHH